MRIILCPKTAAEAFHLGDLVISGRRQDGPPHLFPVVMIFHNSGVDRFCLDIPALKKTNIHNNPALPITVDVFQAM